MLNQVSHHGGATVEGATLAVRAGDPVPIGSQTRFEIFGALKRPGVDPVAPLPEKYRPLPGALSHQARVLVRKIYHQVLGLRLQGILALLRLLLVTVRGDVPHGVLVLHVPGVLQVGQESRGVQVGPHRLQVSPVAPGNSRPGPRPALYRAGVLVSDIGNQVLGLAHAVVSLQVVGAVIPLLAVELVPVILQPLHVGGGVLRTLVCPGAPVVPDVGRQPLPPLDRPRVLTGNVGDQVLHLDWCFFRPQVVGAVPAVVAVLRVTQVQQDLDKGGGVGLIGGQVGPGGPIPPRFGPVPGAALHLARVLSVRIEHPVLGLRFAVIRTKVVGHRAGGAV